MKKFNKTIGALVLSVGLAFSIAPNVLAQQPNADFLDVSHHNAEQGLPLSFYQTIKAGNVNAVVIKVSEGTYYVDPASSVNVANAKQAGMIVHAYHFARFTSNDSAKSEAQWFDKKLQLVGFNKKTDGYVVVDVEATNLSSNPSSLTDYTNTFIDEMKSLGYSKVDLYSGSSYYNSRLQPSKLPANPWIAAYPSNPQAGQPTAKFTNGQGAWQWTSLWSGMSGYGRFDASEDYAGKYTNLVKSATPAGEVKQIGNLSLVDWMKANNFDSSFSNRAKLAEGYGIVGYSGTAAQNLALLSKLQSGVKPAKVNIDNSKLTARPAKEQSSVKPAPSPVAPTKASTYTVRPGESLSSIAKRFGTTVNALATVNGIRNVNIIRTGQVLKMSGPAKAVITQAIAYHKVSTGETVSVLAKRYGSTAAQIKEWNKLDSRYTIYAGKTIRVR